MRFNGKLEEKTLGWSRKRLLIPKEVIWENAAEWRRMGHDIHRNSPTRCSSIGQCDYRPKSNSPPALASNRHQPNRSETGFPYRIGGEHEVRSHGKGK